MKFAVAVISMLILLLSSCGSPDSTLEPSEPPESQNEPFYSNEDLDETEIIVSTDWSKLGTNEIDDPAPRVGAQWYELGVDNLVPSDDYGTLIAYAGQRLMNDWPASSGCLYGLMTLEGVPVTAPIYASVYYPGWYDNAGNRFSLPFIVLDSAIHAEKQGEYDYRTLSAISALDGSWCTNFKDWIIRAYPEGLIIFESSGITLVSPDGDVQRTWPADKIGRSRDEYDYMLLELAAHEGYAGERIGNLLAVGWDNGSDYTKVQFFDLSSGELLYLTPEEAFSGGPDDSEPATPLEPPISGADRIVDSLYGAEAPGLWYVRNECILENGGIRVTIEYYLDDGTHLSQLSQTDPGWGEYVSLSGGIIGVVEQDIASYYRLDTMECIFRTSLNYVPD